MEIVLLRNDSSYPNYTKREGYYMHMGEAYIPVHQFYDDYKPKDMKEDIVKKYFKVKVIKYEDLITIDKAIRQKILIVAPMEVLSPSEQPSKETENGKIERENDKMIKLGKEFVNDKGEFVRFDSDMVEKPAGLQGVKTTYTVSTNGKSLEELDHYPDDNELVYIMLKHQVKWVRVEKRLSLEFAPVHKYLYCYNEDGSESCYEDTIGLGIEEGDSIRVNTPDGVQVRIVSRVEETYEYRVADKVVGKCLCSMFK